MGIKLGLILGSGVSCAVGMPSMGSITERVLSGRNITRNSSEEFVFTDDESSLSLNGDQWIEKIKKLLFLIKRELDTAWIDQADRWTNYEDIYYLIKKLAQGNDPLYLYLKQKIIPEMAGDLIGPDTNEKMSLGVLAAVAGDYIYDIVKQILSPDKNTAIDHEKGYGIIKHISEDGKFDEVEIFTLNHDIAMEQYLQKKEITYVDGFSDNHQQFQYDQATYSFRIWAPDMYNDNCAKVKLTKLHGSIDWYETKYGLGIPQDHESWSRSQRELNNPEHKLIRPVILMGTLNKTNEYTRSIFVDVYHRFFHRLQEMDRMVTIGYGYEDEGINYNLGRWLINHDHKHMLIIEKDKRKLESNQFRIREAMDQVINDMNGDTPSEDKIQTLPCAIEDVSYETFRDMMV